MGEDVIMSRLKNNNLPVFSIYHLPWLTCITDTLRENGQNVSCVSKLGCVKIMKAM